MAIIGKKLEDFTVNAYHNESLDVINFEKDILGSWSLFFFYPADFTFVCPTELEDLQDHYLEFKHLGFKVFSVSTDTHFCHKAWHDTSERINKIQYSMIGDKTGKLARMFDVYDEKTGLANRGAFIVNPEGEIVACDITTDGVGREASEILRKATAAKFIAEHPGLVCPAKWKEGEETLKPGLDLVGKL